MISGQESEFYKAKLRAGRRVCRGVVRPAQLPTNAEIREEVFYMAQSDSASKPRQLKAKGQNKRQHPPFAKQGPLADANAQELFRYRVEALRVMRLLSAYRPQLVGGVLSGRLRNNHEGRRPEICLHVFCDELNHLLAVLTYAGLLHSVEVKRIVKQGDEKLFTHVHFCDKLPVKLSVYPQAKAHMRFRSTLTGRPIPRASQAELELLVGASSPATAEEFPLHPTHEGADRYLILETLLWPLERVKLDTRLHPEGDALYHSLQVFDLAVAELPYDEEFLLAALLHDVGKAIDPKEPIAAGLEVLADVITPRTAWLIEQLNSAHAVLSGTAGARLKRRLSQDESYEELMLLARCDRKGRQAGVRTRDLPEALEYLRKLARMCQE